jgi:hypothetical protein
MNKNQKILLLCSACLFCISIIYAPWETQLITSDVTITLPIKYSEIWKPPDISQQIQVMNQHLMISSILMEWAAIGIVSAILLLVLKSKVAHHP